MYYNNKSCTFIPQFETQLFRFMLKKLIPCLLVIAAFGHFHAQDKAEKALEVFTDKYPQEKVHLLFNKSSYIAGENLWFKSFVFDGYNPSDISTSLFLELYDSNKTLINKKIIPLLEGEGNGNFMLPENLQEGIYYIRAYTTWMANFSEDFQTVRQITIYNPSSQNKLGIDTNAAWTAAVFPEGGTFVDGINTKMAVRLQSPGTPPADWSGYVIDTRNPGEKLVSFKGLDGNVGSFFITPKYGVKYSLIAEDTKGNRQAVDLPEAAVSGVSLQVNTGNDAVKFSLRAKNSTPGAIYKVIGTISNQLVFKARSAKMLEQTYTIPAGQLINGILQLTVFDEQENIVAQRLCFVQPDLLKIKQPEIPSLSLNENPRAFNSFDLAPVADNKAYTVLVMDGQSESPEDENSLLSTLWLTGDIPSKIDTPSQYFTKNHNSEALDALLISEKWKRFDWKMIMSGTYPIIRYQPQPYISYKGKVTVQGKPAADTDMNLLFSMPGNGTKFYTVKTDAAGFFTLKGLYFEDSIKFSYQLNDPKIPKEQVQVIFQPDYTFVPLKKSLPKGNSILIPRTEADKTDSKVKRYAAVKSMQNMIAEKATLIEEVKLTVAKKDKTKELNKKLSSPLFTSINETVFDLVNDNNTAMGSVNILQWLQGRVAGLTIESKMGNYIPTLRGSVMNIYLDEMKVDPSMIGSISTADIAMVKVIKDAFAGGSGGGNGAVAIYTRRGGITGTPSDSTAPSKLKQISLKGFDKQESFITPAYNDDVLKSIPQDFRTTLYWEPYLPLQPKETAKIEFFNNDDAKDFKVIIIGYDRNNFIPVYYNEIIK